MSSLSFKEKSIWGTLVTVGAVSIWYFWTVLAMVAAGAVDLRVLGKVAIGLVVLLVAAEIVYHSVIAGAAGDAAEDERDRLIELRGERIGGLVLGAGVVFTIGHVVLNALFADEAVSQFATVNLLLLSLALSEIGKYVCQLWHYRRGV